MDWWDDLWLNEGFASFVEYLGVQEAEPDWAMVKYINEFMPRKMFTSHIGQIHIH